MFGGRNKSRTEAEGVGSLGVIIAITDIREIGGRRQCRRAGPHQNTAAF